MPERVGHPVERFELRYFAQEKRIDFLVYMPEAHFKGLTFQNHMTGTNPELYYKYNNDGHKHLYKFSDAEKICALVNKLMSAKLDKDFTLELAVIYYDQNSDTIPIETYGVKNGEKIKQNLTF